MKRILVGLLALTLTAMVVGTPRPAAAHHRSHFFGGFGVGTFTGVVLGSALAPRYYYAPPPIVAYQPSPVYVAPYVPRLRVSRASGDLRPTAVGLERLRLGLDARVLAVDAAAPLTPPH